MNIAVLYNKPSARFAKNSSNKEAEEDTELSAREVREALAAKGATATLVPVTEDTIPETVAAITADLVFNLIEWTGVDTPYAMRTFDELLARKLPYTGTTKENYRDTCDKLIIKRLCRQFGLPTADWQEFVTGDEPIDAAFTYPAIVKVSSEHSSVGIGKDSIIRSATDLRRVVTERIARFHQPVFAETFLSGREFQVTILERANGPIVLPPAEIVYAENTEVPLLTYESRWNETHADYSNSRVLLAELSPELSETLIHICKKAFTTMGFRDYARFDIRCGQAGKPYFLELNSNPGLGDDDEYGMTLSYKAMGMRFSDFIWEIVRSSVRRWNITG